MKHNIIDLLAQSVVFQESSEALIDLDCKFILVTTNSSVFLVLGPLREYPYHANLLAFLSDREKIPGRWEKRPDMFTVIPTETQINGGGWFRFDFKNKRMTACGISTAYGRFDEQLLKNFINDKSFYPNLTKSVSD